MSSTALVQAREAILAFIVSAVRRRLRKNARFALECKSDCILSQTKRENSRFSSLSLQSAIEDDCFARLIGTESLFKMYDLIFNSCHLR